MGPEIGDGNVILESVNANCTFQTHMRIGAEGDYVDWYAHLPMGTHRNRAVIVGV